ncbi:lipoprotein-releasing ABC transporter permease subunit [Phenylobacterium montanum]|uniref:Lipoprotein-releasing ABC transporter permease subunit n=1 Tax=Phenylobacterium montanum TaxID=2823693 RepID=A0A975IVD7_9CAUL|nr:lipoprotein-releasing ABC transporter permease subunit [Caulobacter sp. S6]QUD88665.1 lipoprotein-releasing ABC transporter permease subunit [Caulobacter sp. S6]
MTADARPAAPFSQWERSVAARYLRAKRKNGGVALISTISFVGIALAVAVLIIVMSVMNGFRAELLTRILGFNGHLFVAGQVLNEPGRAALVQRLRAIPHVVQAAPMVEAEALVQGRGATSGAVVRGIGPGDLKATPIIAGNIKRGSLNGFGQGDFGGDIILVGDRLAASMGVEPGDTLTLTSPSSSSTAFGSAPISKAYTVGGVFSVGMSEYDQTFIYMPLQQAQLFFGREDSIDKIEIKLDDPDRTPLVRPQVAVIAGNEGVVTDWRDNNQAFFNALEVERNTMRLILLLIVAIAAMNIISGLVMLVKNKGRDIAVLRTMGADQGAIMRIFFLSGAAIGVLGALAGFVLGVLFCTYIKEIQTFVQWVTGADVFNADIYFLSHIPAKLDWNEVIGVLFWALLASFLATLPPAFQAARIDPVEALRYE